MRLNCLMKLSSFSFVKMTSSPRCSRELARQTVSSAGQSPVLSFRPLVPGDDNFHISAKRDSSSARVFREPAILMIFNSGTNSLNFQISPNSDIRSIIRCMVVRDSRGRQAFQPTHGTGIVRVKFDCSLPEVRDNLSDV